MEEFTDYLQRTYGNVSGTYHSYIMAIKILDNIFAQHDILQLEGRSIVTINNAVELFNLYTFIT